MLLALSDAPADPVKRVCWLHELESEIARELRAAYQAAYFEARIQGLLSHALDAGVHGRKTVMAMTRAENEVRGRQVRWGTL